MRVYGDRTRTVSPAALLAEGQADLAAGEVVSALIGLGQLLQGLADAEFEARGSDARSPATDALMSALVSLGVFPSGEGEERASPVEGVSERVIDSLSSHLLTSAPELQVRVPEGYAFYALHPAIYAAAARALPPGDWRVIGIRSIGTSLAAVVAAALKAPPPVTVRPTGHPFNRSLSLSPGLQAEWSAHRGPFVIVDEGPGLSGSSFGAVADALERLGVGRERIAFLPGHGGELGAEASPERRARWAAARRPVARFEDIVLPRLSAGLAALVGPATEPLRDVSGGGWRGAAAPTPAPPVFATQERRKFLHRTPEGVWLVKFAGLGRIGGDKLARARTLHAAGFTPEPAGLVEGFLVERWIEQSAEGALPHPERLADYLRFRAEAFPAAPLAGASLLTLAEMIRVNATEALGPAAAEGAARLVRQAPALEVRVRRVHTDGRLHAWEWLGGDEAVLKADALDHSEAHDLVGAQDIAWDVSGAEAELGLRPDETERLRAGVGADAELLEFMRPAYHAFQLGLWTMAAEAQARWPEEAARARSQADGYARRLAALLGVDPPDGRV